MIMHNTRRVYSTDVGRICPGCKRPTSACTCKKKKTSQILAKTDGIIRIRREVKGRKGKTVTSVSGFQLNGPELKKMGTALKQRCGTGGSVKDGVILIQGDHRNTVLVELEHRGFNVKLAGG